MLEIYQEDDFQYGLPKLIDEIGEVKSFYSILSSEQSLNHQDKKTWTLLMVAAHKGYKVFSQKLIEKRADIEIENNDGWRAVMMASHLGFSEVVNLLISAKANVNAQNKIGMTPLMLAASRGHREVIKSLLAAGANVNIKDKSGEPGVLPKPRVFESTHPYHHNMRDYTSVQIYGADSYVITFDERSCTDKENDYIVFYNGWSYIDVNSSKNIERYGGGMDDTVKHFPGMNGIPPLVINDKRFMFQFVSDWQKADWGYKMTVEPKYKMDERMNGWTVLLWASFKGQTALVDIIVQAGADVDVQAWDGKTALAWAIERNAEATAIALLRNGAKVDLPDKDDITPVEKAVRNNLHTFISEVFDTLFKTEDDLINMSTSAAFVWTFLLSSTNNHHTGDVCKVLDKYPKHIKALADVKDKSERSAIGIACPQYRAAIMERLFFYKRFELNEGPPAHMSDTCILILAIDHDDHEKKVALKFMKNRVHYERECQTRTLADFDKEYVINTFAFYNGDENKVFRDEADRRQLYPYCICMPAAERNLLDIISHEHISGREWEKLASMSRELTNALAHMHSKGYIHGDFKPMNIVRSDGKLKLIDLDGAANYLDYAYVGEKTSSTFVPPEMVVIVDNAQSNQPLENCEQHMSSEPPAKNSRKEVRVREFKVDGTTKEPITSDLPYSLLQAQVSYDMWSLGATLYQLFTGETLFNGNDVGNIDKKQLILLYNWDDDTKHEKLLKIKHPGARNLVSRLLSKDPFHRPDTAQVLAHPYLSGKSNACRMIGDKGKYDIFISYRVWSDKAHALALYHLLRERGSEVYLDQKCLEPGQDWEAGFCAGLIASRIYVPLISKTGCDSFLDLSETSLCDNFYLELRMALELKTMGMLDAIYPVFIGDYTVTSLPSNICEEKLDNSDHEDYKNRIYTELKNWKLTGPDASVKSVEKELRKHLEGGGLGVPHFDKATVQFVTECISKHQGVFVKGCGNDAFSGVADTIKKMCTKQFSDDATVTVEAMASNPDVGHDAEIERLKKELEDLLQYKQRNEDLIQRLKRVFPHF